METYFFALGTNHTLSKIDIVNTLLGKGIDFEIIEASQEILIVATNTELDLQKLINELGSAAKVGKVLGVYEKDNWPEQFLEDNLKEQLKGEKFGISVYGAGGKFKELNEVFYSRSKISDKFGGLREIREQGRILSTVAVDKNGLLKEGFELVICVGSKGIYIGKTNAVQDYEGYSLRDYGRPGRDTKSGMIPPKLAKMMINLAGKSKAAVFLDPFCGSGTFLQELLILGYKNIIGADVEEQAVLNTRENLEWLKTNFSKVTEVDKVKLIKSDARSLSSKISYKTIDAIVTEPYLGSSKARLFNPDQIKKEIKKLEDLYFSAFCEFNKILNDKGRIVIIFPVFRFNNDFFKLGILSQLKELGFVTSEFIEKKVTGEEILKLEVSDRNSIVFFRPGQTVSREIFTFKRV